MSKRYVSEIESRIIVRARKSRRVYKCAFREGGLDQVVFGQATCFVNQYLTIHDSRTAFSEVTIPLDAISEFFCVNDIWSAELSQDKSFRELFKKSFWEALCVFHKKYAPIKRVDDNHPGHHMLMKFVNDHGGIRRGRSKYFVEFLSGGGRIPGTIDVLGKDGVPISFDIRTKGQIDWPAVLGIEMGESS